MKRILMLWLVLVSLLVLLLPSSVSAASKVTKFKFQGDSAFASFSSTDPTDPCIQSSAFVSVTEGRIKEGPGKPEPISEVFVDISQYNTCTDEFLLGASGSALLAPDAFVVQGKLDSATLTTTVQVCDFVTGDCFPVEVNLTWTGTGPITSDKFKFQSKSPGCKVKFDFKGEFRDAVATGSITGGGFTFSGTADFAQLASVKQGNMEIGCGDQG